jgi:CubicO group peptidase (beta-lactamase class C family)
MRFILLAILLPSLVFAQKKTSLEQKIKEFDQYVEAGRTKWEVPGMAVAVVKAGYV